MMHIIHRLTAATVNAELRDQMNTEDLYTSVLEKRDTDIMIRNAMIAEQDRIIAEKDEQLRALEKLMC